MAPPVQKLEDPDGHHIELTVPFEDAEQGRGSND